MTGPVRVLICVGAVAFAVGDWLLDRLNAALADQREDFRNTIDDLLSMPYEPAPWLADPLEAP